jgi:hypothetical protein
LENLGGNKNKHLKSHQITRKTHQENITGGEQGMVKIVQVKREDFEDIGGDPCF